MFNIWYESGWQENLTKKVGHGYLQCPAGSKRERERKKNVYDVIERYEIRMVASNIIGSWAGQGEQPWIRKGKRGNGHGESRWINFSVQEPTLIAERKGGEMKKKEGGRDKIPRVKRAPVVNIVGISLLFFQKFIFSLDRPASFLW